MNEQAGKPRSGRKTFNLSALALDNASVIWYFMIVSMVAGVLAYLHLGREEDPQFTIKTMVIAAMWPGASVEDTVNQVTDRLEKKLEELDQLDYTKSETTPGQTTIYVHLRSTTKGPEVKAIWGNIRHMIDDIKPQLPQGVIGPFYNDRFGDVFGNVYAFTADGVSQRQLRDYVESARTAIMTVPNVGKVDLIGAQDDVIYLEFNSRRIAALGLDLQTVLQAVQAQNAIVPSGVIQSGPERVSVRVSGQFVSEESLKAFNLRVNDRFFRLSDIVDIRRGYADPPSSLFRYNGTPAIGLAISMKAGANLLEFGKGLNAELDKITSDLPIGVEVHLVADQPKVVEEAIGHFTRSLFEAVVIVLIVSFISLGLRAGLIVALAIPLVLAMTFLGLQLMGVTLQRVSLGALVIALGLLVDDAMIAIEMMIARLERGDSLRQAAMQIYTATAFPRLTGTLVIIAGFTPIAFNTSDAGEYTYTLFAVLALSLLLSWLVAGIFTPLLGYSLLPKQLHKHDKPGRFFVAFQKLLAAAMRWRWLTIGITLATFALSVVAIQMVPQQFFPASDRPELLIDWTLPQNASIEETRDRMDRFEKTLEGDPDIDHWSSYVGQSAVRFILTLDIQPPNAYYGQTVIVTKDMEARERVRARIARELKDNFVGTDAYVSLLALGPPAGRAVQYRISGPSVQKVRELAQDLATIVGASGGVGAPIYDWNEPARVLKVDVLQDKARQLGLSSAEIASLLNGTVGGIPITQVRDSIYLVNVVARAGDGERGAIETLQNLQLTNRTGKAVPLAAVATFQYEQEQPVIWRRNRLPTITVKADIVDAELPASVVARLEPAIKAFTAKLPAGYRLATGGPVEESAKSQAPIMAVVPLMLLIMATVLMLQLRSFNRLFLVASVAPLALIGVALALFLSQSALGFVAILGIIALIGILIRNSVILVVQIETLRSEGRRAWDAVTTACEERVRPIMLTAAAASLGMVPIARDVFWAPMAFAMMGGIIVGTALTLLFLPALYVAWFRIKEESDASPQPQCKKTAECKIGCVYDGSCPLEWPE
ncbi:efflux RND transporter permease subunit [Oryzibacter oryziterrae]|uniref:efflux RND transporter permease subunit n=1 Tax=Oryzibacter oryziterrae TaxID=2766474 RepID=UPI001F464AEA|nr:efflux RND transporter permease subunit [Oryzibacter oryziterrae]